MQDRQLKDSFKALMEIETTAGIFSYFSLPVLGAATGQDVSKLPVSIRILLEAVARAEDGELVCAADVKAVAAYDPRNPPGNELPFLPARVLLQDFTGVPAVVDLAAMRSAVARFGGDPRRINPLIPVDLVIDHSIQIDNFGDPGALAANEKREFERNGERYQFLRWGQKSFDNFRVVPPGSGIVHQVNLEFLADVVCHRTVSGHQLVFPDSLVGTDSHTTMINGLGVVGWGVGGIEAEAAMLGQPLYMLPPPVVGLKLTGAMPAGTTATDLVLAITELLRHHGVVGKFVEFYGNGLSNLSLTDRATIANMAPEYGATMGFFPVDAETLRYLRTTGRSEEQIDLVEQYWRAQGIFRTDDTAAPDYGESLSFDLASVKPSLAGPKRPQDRIELDQMKSTWHKALQAPVAERGFALSGDALTRDAAVDDEKITHGAVTIAAITSCTNTSNPAVLIAAGLLAQKAVAKGLTRKPHVKTSLAPGSLVVTDYLRSLDLLSALEALGFHVVGYGCTTCIGNSGPLPPAVEAAVKEGDLIVASVLSGNRNFEGRIHPLVKASYLASPPLVVGYAIAGTVDIDFATDPLGHDGNGKPVMLTDIWPTSEEIEACIAKAITPERFQKRYTGLTEANANWNAIDVTGGEVFSWDESSTYIQEPPFFVDMEKEVSPIQPIEAARALLLVGDSITTDHISPAGAFASDSPAGEFLTETGVSIADFNTYGSRRGNDRIMTRGTFANIRLKNQLAPGTEGGFTTYFPTDDVMSIYAAAGKYRASGTPTIVLAGKDYGMGSSRDWAAKGTNLLGVKAVIAESYERIHRSNLVGMGVLPLEFLPGDSAASLGLTGRETFQIPVTDQVAPGAKLSVVAKSDDGAEFKFDALCRLDTAIDVVYYRNGGILHTVLRGIITK
jgi:aconitate hydratase A / 2-methylisocitrate dehydratase